MTRTVCPCTDPCFASLSIPESSGATRENRPASEGLLQRCPKAMLLANTSTKPRRLPQAALWRSWRPGGLRNFCVRTISVTLSLRNRGTIAFRTALQLHGGSHSLCRKLLINREIFGLWRNSVGQSVPRTGAGDNLSHFWR